MANPTLAGLGFRIEHGLPTMPQEYMVDCGSVTYPHTQGCMGSNILQKDHVNLKQVHTYIDT